LKSVVSCENTYYFSLSSYSMVSFSVDLITLKLYNISIITDE